MNSAPTPFLKGEKIFLRAVEEGDAGEIAVWLNDPEVTYYMFYGQLPLSKEKTKAFIEEHVNSPSNVVFMVCDLKSGEAIGFAGLYGIHLTARKAEFRILIGNKNYWGKGYGTEVTELLMFYGFDRLNLHRVWLGVTSENKGAIRAYEKAGYIVEGVLKEDIYRNSCFYDSVRMAKLRDDYYERLFEKHKNMFG